MMMLMRDRACHDFSVFWTLAQSFSTGAAAPHVAIWIGLNGAALEQRGLGVAHLVRLN